MFIFTVVSFALGDRSKKMLLQFMSKNVLPMFSSRIFMVSRLTFRSLIHFEFISVYGVKKCSNIFLLHVVLHKVLLLNMKTQVYIHSLLKLH